MSRQRINFTGPNFQARSKRVNNQLTVNMYSKPTTAQAKAPVVCYELPGLKDGPVIGLGPHRGRPLKFGTSWFTVSGDAFIEVDSAGTATTHGTLLTTSGRIKMVSNFSTQILLIDGTHGYIWDGATLVEVTTNFPANPIDCAYLNSYFMVVDGGTNNFHISALEDGLTWAALDYGVAQSRPDNLMAISTDTGDVWLPGTESLEIWFNSGNATFPFQILPGMVFDYGCAATASMVAFDSNPIWLSNTPYGGGIIVTALGRQPKIVSDDDLNWQLSQLTRLDDAFASIHFQSGDPFYVITFPTDNVTFGLDIKTGWWHTREAPDGGAWDVAGIINYNNQHIAVSRTNGKTYILDYETHTDSGENRRRARRAALVDDNSRLMTHNSLELILDVGVGTLSGEGIDPTVQLRYSDDGGNTWSDFLSQPLGQQGAYDTRVIFQQLGDSYGRIYEASTHHPVEFTIIDAYIDWETA